MTRGADSNVCETDLDLCRNPDLLLLSRPWACERCSTEYSRPLIESLIISSLTRKLTSYQLQDLRCLRCKSIKTDNLRLNCECSGEYGMAEGRVEVLRRLGVVGNVAEWHGLEVLGDVVRTMKAMI